ncbi:hypothetical protein TYRP_000551 [Tyrophagus putrescentiae]|nr:hypothetical protein TYRP_000551 [Tyrophagus putrescentiae]
MITKTSALELGAKGVRVNSINPGPVATAFGRSFGLDEASGEELIKGWGTATVLKRVATSDEIATLAGFLASDDAKNITGAIIITDSGMVLN